MDMVALFCDLDDFYEAFAPAWQQHLLPAPGRHRRRASRLVHVLANELRGRNVTVNAVAPGPVVTEFFLKDKGEEQFTRMVPLERLGQPEDQGAEQRTRYDVSAW